VITNVRFSIDRCLRRPLSDGEWNMVVNEGVARQVDVGEMAPAGAAAYVEQWRHATAETREAPRMELPPMRGNPARDARGELIAFLMSRYAARLDEVREFREEFLPKGPLPIEQVESWLQARAQEQPFIAWFEVPIPGDAGDLRHDESGVWVDPPFSVSKEHPATSVRSKWLYYALPDRPEQKISVAASGVLAQLRSASEKIAQVLGCSEGDATMFVLTRRSVSIHVCERSFVLRGADQIASLNRIRLTIDPTLSPREVANIYADMRRKIFGRQRYRAMSEKHIRLAIFAFMRPAEESLKDKMAAWNKAHSKWRYRQETIFGRDLAAARRRAITTVTDHPKTTQQAVEEWLVEGGEASPAKAGPKPKARKGK
jgi:hypothetical protein